MYSPDENNFNAGTCSSLPVPISMCVRSRFDLKPFTISQPFGWKGLFFENIFLLQCPQTTHTIVFAAFSAIEVFYSRRDRFFYIVGVRPIYDIAAAVIRGVNTQYYIIKRGSAIHSVCKSRIRLYCGDRFTTFILEIGVR